MHGDMPKIASNVQGKDTACMGSRSDTMLCMEVMGTACNESA